MRTLSSTLATAQKSQSGAAIVKVVFSGTGATTKTYTTGDTVNRIISITEHEQPYSQRAAIVLSNADGEFTALNLMGYKCVISMGFTTSSGDEYSALPPMYVTEQRLISSGRGLSCSFKVIGNPNILANDRASGNNILLSSDTQTVKTLVRTVAGDTGVTHMAVFNHTMNYDVVFDQEDSLIDTYNPADGLRVYTNSPRLAVLRRLFDFSKCAGRWEDDGKLHVLIPTIATTTAWQASTAYALNDTRIPTTANGVEYICTTAGTSGSSEPTWPTEVGNTVTDNTVTWTVSYDYDYRLSVATYHTFYNQGEHNALVIPNYITVKSNPGDETQYSGNASDSTSIDALVKGLGTGNGEIRQYLMTRLGSNQEGTDIATALLSKYQLNAQTGAALVPMNVGAEVYDYVKITDSRINQNHTGNISTITRYYIQKTGTSRMRITFGGWHTARDLMSDIEINTDATITEDNTYPRDFVGSQFKSVVVGDYLAAFADTERSKASTPTIDMTKVKELICPVDGQLRIKFDMHCNGVAEVYGRIYRKTGSAAAVAVGTNQSTTSATYVTYSEDLSGWSAGDLVQLYYSGNNIDQNIEVFVRNFRVYASVSYEWMVGTD